MVTGLPRWIPPHVSHYQSLMHTILVPASLDWILTSRDIAGSGTYVQRTIIGFAVP